MLEETNVRNAFFNIGGRNYKTYVGELEWTYLQINTNPAIRQMMQKLIDRFHRYHQDVQSSDTVLAELAKPNSQYVNNRKIDIVQTIHNQPKNIMWILNQRVDGKYNIGKPVNTKKLLHIVRMLINDSYSVERKLTNAQLSDLTNYLDRIVAFQTDFQAKLQAEINKLIATDKTVFEIDNVLYTSYDGYVDKITVTYNDAEFNEILANVWARFDSRDTPIHEINLTFNDDLGAYIQALQQLKEYNQAKISM